jgi:hypothetical protein
MFSKAEVLEIQWGYSASMQRQALSIGYEWSIVPIPAADAGLTSAPRRRRPAPN